MTKSTEDNGSLDSAQTRSPLPASDGVGVAIMDVLRASITSVSSSSSNPHSSLAEEFNLSSRIHQMQLPRWWS